MSDPAQLRSPAFFVSAPERDQKSRDRRCRQQPFPVMNCHHLCLPGLIIGVALAGPARAQFIDAFGAIDPAWVTNRYEPAGYATAAGGDGDLLSVMIQD